MLVSAVLTNEEYERTEKICMDFTENEAMDFQLPLMHKAASKYLI